jgi:hypothetical protein
MEELTQLLQNREEVKYLRRAQNYRKIWNAHKELLYYEVIIYNYYYKTLCILVVHITTACYSINVS